MQFHWVALNKLTPEKNSPKRTSLEEYNCEALKAKRVNGTYYGRFKISIRIIEEIRGISLNRDGR